MLYAINLAGDGEIMETPVSKSFGLTDMYRDFKDAKNQHSLEQRLANVESAAGRIIAKIRKSHEDGEPEVWMSRKERNTLRKFLFVMKYRSAGLHSRFQWRTAEEYCADDREFMLDYMRKKGFTSPVDVWFDNINALLDLEIGLDLQWAAKLSERMYPGDAMWAFTHIQAMYMALCIPEDECQEFLLSENLFGIHEGPVSSSVNVDTAPRLIIVLRSCLLPNEEEDAIVGAKKAREIGLSLNQVQHNDPSRANSLLEDLPVRKANNSYTMIVNGKRVLRPGEDGSPRSDHQFGFPLFPIEHKHVNLINTVIFEQAFSSRVLCFHSKPAARAAIDWFTGPADPRFKCLKKLEHAARTLGAHITADYHFWNPDEAERKMWEEADKEMRDDAREGGYGFSSAYLSLGGSGKTLAYDMDQSARMRYLRVKIDVWSQGLDPSARSQIRTDLNDLFSQLLPRRFYFYLKHIKFMELSFRLRSERARETMKGPEDVIASAAKVFSKDRLTMIMYHAGSNHVKSLEFKALEPNGAHLQVAGRLNELKLLMLTSTGSICDCGIATVESRAKEHRAKLEAADDDQADPPFIREPVKELMIRATLQREFLDLMEGNLPRDQLESLKAALFGMVYPSGLGESQQLWSDIWLDPS